MKEKKKKVCEKPTVTTVKSHYVGTESMSEVFERVFISQYQARKQAESSRDLDK